MPQAAVPTTKLLSLLEDLAKDRRSVVAVVSGRSSSDLEHWFAGIPNLWLAAEHGAVLRSPVTNVWEQPHSSHHDQWKQRVRPILEHFVERTPGSFIEEKAFSLVWHYRMADAEFGDWLANDLVANLDHMLADSSVKAVKGQKAVEIKLIWAKKGQVYSRLLPADRRPDFILAVGDDVTDEDLFAQLPRRAWTIHVGRTHSRARYYLPSPTEVVSMLAQLLESQDCLETDDLGITIPAENRLKVEITNRL